MTQRPSEGFGRRLAKYRKIAGLSAQALSDRLGGELSRGVIANLESGRKQDVTIDQLVMLSAALAISPIVLALPVDEPEVMVRVIGMEDDASDRRATRAHLLIGWFLNQPSCRVPVQEFSNLGSAIASQTVKAVDEFYWAKAHQLLVMSKAEQDEGALIEANAEVDSARERAQELGVDLRKFELDE